MKKKILTSILTLFLLLALLSMSSLATTDSQEIKLTNLVPNGDFTVDMTGWTSNSASKNTLAADNGVGTQTRIVTDEDTKMHAYSPLSATIPSGHIVYIRADTQASLVKDGAASTAWRQITFSITNAGTGVGVSNNRTATTDFGQQSAHNTATASANRVQFYLSFNSASFKDTVLRFDNAMVIDLTEAFGAGNEPDKAWCDNVNNIPYFNGSWIVGSSTFESFGAVGDGITDDTEAVQAAFDSSDALICAKGTYLVTRNLTISASNKKIIGVDNARIVTDKSYNVPAEYNNAFMEWLILISGSNITIKDLRIETLEATENFNSYKTQIGIRGASETSKATNITLDGCTFRVAEGLYWIDGSGNCRGWNNVDLYSGWNNVTVSDCTLSLLTNAEAGTCLMIRDIKSRGGDNAQIINNTMAKRSHDEIVWIYGIDNVMTNIVVSGNTIVMETGTASCSSVAFTISSQATSVSDVVFTENEINAETSYSLFNITNSTNVSINNNDITFSKVSDGNSCYVFNSAITHEGKSDSNQDTPLTNENLEIESNNLVIDNSTGAPIKKIFNSTGAFINNNVTLNGAVNYVIAERPTAVEGNIIELNGSVDALVFNSKSVTNNEITVNGTASWIFYYLNTAFAQDIMIDGNTISIETEKANNEMLRLDNVTMGIYKMILNDNNITLGTADTWEQRAGFGNNDIYVPSTGTTNRLVRVYNKPSSDNYTFSITENEIYNYLTISGISIVF